MDESYETIGGLLLDRLGHIPQHPGEKAEIDEGKLTLMVMQMRGRRIVKVKIIAHQMQDESGRKGSTV
jgi:CBS domain containing-hemolysin-like protein